MPSTHQVQASDLQAPTEKPGAFPCAAICFAAGVLMAAPTLRSYFVADDLVSLHSVTVTAPWRYLYSNWLGFMGQGGFYRPVFNWLLGLCWLPFGLDPLPFRALQTLLFGANCALVAVLARRSSGSATGALLAGLFFAAHPVHAEAIGWISSILEQACALFFLLSILAFDRGRIVASTLLMALSLGSKEMGIVVPPVALLWGLSLRRDRSVLRAVLPLFILAGLYVAFRLAILGGMGGYGDRHLRFAAVDNNLVHYLGFMIEPLPALGLDRSAGGKSLAVVAAAFLGLAALWRVLELPRWKGVGLGIGWFFLAWLPVATLLRTQYLFLPSAGAAIALAGILGPLLEEARRKGQSAIRLAVALGAVLWLLAAGNALLGKLKVWEAGGQLVEAVLRQSRDLLGDGAPGAVVFYENLPVNIGVPVFQHGIGEGLRLYLGRQDVDARRLDRFEDLPSFVDPWRARFFRQDKGVLEDRTAAVRARLGRP